MNDFWPFWPQFLSLREYGGCSISDVFKECGIPQQGRPGELKGDMEGEM